MRRENKKQKFFGQLKNAFSETEEILEPIKSFVRQHLSQIVKWLVLSLEVLLIFPFAVRSIVAEISVLVLLILIWNYLIKSKKGATAKRFWIIAISMLVFGAVCPFLISPYPLYIAFAASSNPSKESLEVLRSHDKTIGSTILLSDLDFIRKEIADVLSTTLPDEFRLLKANDSKDGTYYVLPSFNGYVFTLNDPGDNPLKKNIYFPVDVPNCEIKLDLRKHKTLDGEINPKTSELTFGRGFSLAPLVNFNYAQYAETIPWEAVEVKQGREASALGYVALLDRSLEFFAEGNYEDALDGLESAAKCVPAENLEGARLGVLKLAFVQYSFTGNVGDLQALPFLHKAYDLLLNSRSDPRFSEKDPLTNWLRERLYGGYLDLLWSTDFLDRVSRLNNMPHIVDDGELYTQTLHKELERKSNSELLEYLQTNNCCAAELHFMRYFVFNRFWEHVVANFNKNSLVFDADINLATNLQINAKQAYPVIQLLDATLARKGGLKASRELGADIKFFAYDFPEFAKLKDTNEVQQYISHASQDNPFSSVFTNLAFKTMNLSPTNVVAQTMNSQWWSLDYLSWFFGWSFGAAELIGQKNDPKPSFTAIEFPQIDIRKIRAKFGNDYLIKDMAGHGRLFLPGLFFLTWYSETFGLDEDDKLKHQFEDEAKLPFETCLQEFYVNADMGQNESTQ